MRLFYSFNFKRNYDVLKSKNPRKFLNKDINFSKNETESKMENTPHSFRETNLVFQFIWELQIKSKAQKNKKKKRSQKETKDIFCNVYFAQRTFFNICVLSQCIVYWIHFQTIHTFRYQKALLHTLFYLFLKSLKTFSVSLKRLGDLFHHQTT